MQVLRPEAVPVRLLMAVATPKTIVELSDGTYRWWDLAQCKPKTTGPNSAWVRQGLSDHSVKWNGPAIQEMPFSKLLIRNAEFSPRIQRTRTVAQEQAALRQLALRQLEALQTTLQQIVSITDDQGDREAVEDVVSNTGKSQYFLRQWFGGSQETSLDE